jgi:hypothetical protein
LNGGISIYTNRDYTRGLIANVLIEDIVSLSGFVSLSTSFSAIGNVTLQGLQSVAGSFTVSTLIAPITNVVLSGSAWALNGGILVASGIHIQGAISSITLNV